MKNLREFTLFEEKTNGIQIGGIYTLNGEKYMIKLMRYKDTVAELVGTRIARLVAGDSAPEVFLEQKYGLNQNILIIF